MYGCAYKPCKYCYRSMYLVKKRLKRCRIRERTLENYIKALKLIRVPVMENGGAGFLTEKECFSMNKHGKVT